jgi:hypothetical protein
MFIKGRRNKMNASKLIGALLIAGGVLGLSFGGFSYTKETNKATLGPIAISVAEKETVNFPLWLSIVAIAAGTGLLMASSKKS